MSTKPGTYDILIDVPEADRVPIKKELYERYADAYERRTVGGLHLYEKDMQLFARLTLHNGIGNHIIDLGSGPGLYAARLSRLGLHPLCIDISHEAIRRCERKGLETRAIDYESRLVSQFPSRSLDGVWTNCSLTTIPQVGIEKVLDIIHTQLKDKAPAFFGFIEGNEQQQGFIAPDHKYALPRYRFRTDEASLRSMLTTHGFQILRIRRLPKEITHKNTYLNAMCIKR